CSGRTEMTIRTFALPDLGEGLTEAEIIQWRVAPGDTVAVDQPIVEVETAKAAVEVPCPFAGTVTALHAEEDTSLAVGAPLLSVEDGLGAEADGSDAGGASAEAESTGGAEDGGSGNVLVGYGTSGSATARRRRRRGQAAPATEPAGTVEAAAPGAAAASAAPAAPEAPATPAPS